MGYNIYVWFIGCWFWCFRSWFELKIGGKVSYFGGDYRKYNEGVGKWEKEEGKLISSVLLSSLLFWGIEV